MFTVSCIEKTKIKRKRGREWPIFLKKRKIASRRVKSKRERERERERDRDRVEIQTQTLKYLER